MKTLVIGFIAKSLEGGILQKLLIQALRSLVTKTTNTVDDKVVDLLEQTLKNETVDTAISEALAKVAEKANKTTETK
jgi:hypothetical protein